MRGPHFKKIYHFRFVVTFLSIFQVRTVLGMDTIAFCIEDNEYRKSKTLGVSVFSEYGKVFVLFAVVQVIPDIRFFDD